MSNPTQTEARPGGHFLVAPVPEGGVFSRELLDEEQQMFAQIAEKYWRNEVLTRIDAIENKELVEVAGKQMPVGLMLVRQAGELGMLGIDLPEEYGGLGYGKVVSSRLAEASGGCASQACTMGATAGIGTLPIVLFGTKEQKEKYLPRLIAGELISCYALTEPGSGSDALSGKTTATRSEDQEAFLLNGEKQYITNGGWADMAIVFAQLEGQYTAFIVDLHSPGVSRGAEEKKMGIRGSSTCSLIFSDVRVPKENMLGSQGDAARIALNILYVGRLKLGFGTLGSAKYAIDLAIKFGRERKQFGQPVITFDIQKAKLADMVCGVYAMDSLSYRTVGAIDVILSRIPKDDPKHDDKEIEILRGFAVEASILKIFGSETLMKVANHGVRMHGGYGFTEEYNVERVMRDNVVDTIFEGTNDINRLVIFQSLVQKVYGAEIPFRESMETLWAELRAGEYVKPMDDGPLAELRWKVTASKRAVSFVFERALLGLGKDIRVEQQIAAATADLLIALYAAESTVSRVIQTLADAGPEKGRVLEAIAQLLVYEKGEEIRKLAKEIVAHVVSPGLVCEKLEIVSKLLAPLASSIDVVGLRRLVAEHAIESGRYDL